MSQVAQITALRQQLEGIHLGLLTGDMPYAGELSGLIGQAMSVARRMEDQAKCDHHTTVEREESNRGGRRVFKLCVVCRKELQL